MHARTLAVYNLVPNPCVACRSKFNMRNQDPPCDETDICSITGDEVISEDEPMEISIIESEVVNLWDQAISLSPKQMFTKQQGEQRIVLWLPTLKNLNIVLENTDWDYYCISKKTAVYLISLFHQTYIESMQSG
jgi:hypothetical protein